MIASKSFTGSAVCRPAARAWWRGIFAVLVCLTAGVAAAIDDHPPFDDPKLQARYERLTEELRCVKCQNNNIADSNADIARDLRRQVHEMLEAGRSDREILDFMVQRYGDFVLYRPAFKPANYLLWFAPVLLTVAGLLVFLRIIRSRAALLDDEYEEDGEEAAAGDGLDAGGTRGTTA